jgi:nitrite reductase/ring-hydroxylating ferredoxin subunit
MAPDRHVASLDAVGETTFLFTARHRPTDERREILLVRTDDGVAAWLNRCQHILDVPIDKGSGATMRDGELVCTNHGAYFEADTGYCTFGPCEGAYLTAVDVEVRDGDVYLADEAYDSVDTVDADHGPSNTSTFEF